MQKLAFDFSETLSNGLGRAFSDAITKGGSFGSKMQAMWKGVTDSAVQALMQMSARQIVNWGIEKGISAWKAATGAKEITQEGSKAAATVASQSAQTTAITTAATTQATALTIAITAQSTAMGLAMSAALDLAAAETWAAYAGMPFVGAGLAIDQIAAMAGSMAAEVTASKALIVAHATGGIISQPTLALMGEAGTELVAPEHDFKDWASQLSGAHASLGYNLAAHDAQVGRLQSSAGSYSSQGLAQSGGTVPGSRVIDARNSMFMDSMEAKRNFDRLLTDSDVRTGRASG
jgi:hypothetical protein